MPTTADSVAERRVTPRFQTSVAAELASGTCLIAVTVHDMSMTGCGVEIAVGDAGLAEALGATGCSRCRPSTGPRPAPSCP